MNFSTNQLLLYKLFLSYPNRDFYMQEIGRILGKKPGVFQRTLNNIESDGFVISEFKANARFFKLNKNYPILKEITSIIKKTSSEINLFKEKIDQLDLKKKNSSHKKSTNKTKKTEKIYPTKLSDLQTNEVLTSLQTPEQIEQPAIKKAEPANHDNLKTDFWTEKNQTNALKKKKNKKSDSEDQLSLF